MPQQPQPPHGQYLSPPGAPPPPMQGQPIQGPDGHFYYPQPQPPSPHQDFHSPIAQDFHTPVGSAYATAYPSPAGTPAVSQGNSNVVHLQNLPQDVQGYQIQQLLSLFGNVLNIELCMGSNGASAVAIITFQDSQSAKLAAGQLDGSFLPGFPHAPLQATMGPGQQNSSPVNVVHHFQSQSANHSPIQMSPPNNYPPVQSPPHHQQLLKPHEIQFPSHHPAPPASDGSWHPLA